MRYRAKTYLHAFPVSERFEKKNPCKIMYVNKDES